MARGRAIILALFIPLAFIIYFFTPVFEVLHQNERVATLALSYMRWALPGALF